MALVAPVELSGGATGEALIFAHGADAKRLCMAIPPVST